MVCGLLLIPAEGILGTTAAGYLISMGMSLMSLLIALLFYDLSKRMGIAIIALTGVVRVNSLFTLWGGKTNQQIERELFIASGTLKAHIQHIYVKCGVHSRKELIALCGGE